MKKMLLFLFFCTVAISVTSLGVVVSPSLSSDKGIVASANEYASRIGAEILEKGGNAIDAAVAVSLALGVAEPYASGIGGEGYAIISLADGRNYFLDFKSEAPSLANPDNISKLRVLSLEELRYTPKAAMVPGVAAGIEAALEIGGTMSISDLIRPSIELARKGFIVNETFSKTVGDKYELLLESAPDFLNEYLVWEEGDLFTNEFIAETYEEISENGVDSFYRGKIAEDIAQAMEENEGFIQKGDLSEYGVKTGTPLIGDYRGYEIVAPQQPVSGAEVISIMNILENFDLSNFKEYDPLLIHLMYQAIMLESVDSSHYLGDPDFSELPTKGWISKEYAKSRLPFINFNSFIPTEEYRNMFGNPHAFESDESYVDVYSASDENAKQNINESHGSTTHFSVVDRYGNAVSWTQTLSSFFGCGVYVDGFFLNNEIWNFTIDENSKNTWMIEPGKRPATTIAPLIIKKDGKVRYVLGTPGGERIVPTVVQMIVDLVDLGKNAEQTVKSPKFSSFVGYDIMHMENTFPDETVSYLEKFLNYKIQLHDYPDLYFGGPNIIEVDDDGIMHSMGSVRRNGSSAAPQY